MSPYLRITPLLLVFPGRYSMLERRMVRTAIFLHPEIGFMLQCNRRFHFYISHHYRRFRLVPQQIWTRKGEIVAILGTEEFM